MAEYIQVVTTVASKEEGKKIARALLEKRLVGCVHIAGPIESSYWWQGKIEQAEEWLCIAKTERKLFAPIAETITALHSYDVPEVLAVPIVEGSESYLRWLQAQVATMSKST